MLNSTTSFLLQLQNIIIGLRAMLDPLKELNIAFSFLSSLKKLSNVPINSKTHI